MCLLAVIIIHRTFLLLFLTLLFYRLAEHLNESLYRSYVCLAFSIVRARIIFFFFYVYIMLRLHILSCPFPNDFTYYECSKCVHIYTPPLFQRSDNDHPFWSAGYLSHSWNLSRRSCLAKPVVCVVLKYVRVQKKTQRKNVKC